MDGEKMGRFIELEVGGIKSVAELLDDKAPFTCNALWDALPLDAIGNHAKFAGEEVFFIFSRSIERSQSVLED